jgi:hypothetical protein
MNIPWENLTVAPLLTLRYMTIEDNFARVIGDIVHRFWFLGVLEILSSIHCWLRFFLWFGFLTKGIRGNGKSALFFYAHAFVFQ